jgi:hypothetical protein
LDAQLVYHIRRKSKNSFCWAKQISPFGRAKTESQNRKGCRTSCSSKKWRASAHPKIQKALKIRPKTNGQHCVPPCSRLEKFQKVRFWCNYTVPLELTLSKIVENFQTHPAAPRPVSGASNARKIPIIFRGARKFFF